MLGTYAAALAVTSRWTNERSGIAVSLLATLLVAVSLGAVRDRVERRVRRAVFTHHDATRELLEEMGSLVHGHTDGTVLLEGLARVIRRSGRWGHVAILDRDAVTIAAVGTPSDAELQVPLVHQGVDVGTLVVGRRDDRGWTSAERARLEAPARQVAAAVQGVGLEAEIREARQRLVRGREHERVRIRRDLHDGIGPVLAAATLQVDALARRLEPDDEDGRALAARIRAELQRAVNEVRSLIDGLRPAALDQLGLAAVLEEHAVALRDAGIDVEITVSGKPAQAGPAAEVAAYRIIGEAMTNALRHADPTRVLVTVDALPSGLDLRVVDDGSGLAPGRREDPGVGLVSMRDRAAELGGWLMLSNTDMGGTEIRAHVPTEATS
jgi:signal transduction histidine kinase